VVVLVPTAASAASTPYLNRVAATLRQRSPGTEGKLWWISRGNTLPTGWLLQTPDCWGQLACLEPPPGGEVFLSRITDVVSRARVSVDFAGLFPPPMGLFREAIVEGLKQAKARGFRPLVRVLLGTPPGNAHQSPRRYVSELSAAIGGGLPIQAAYMSTYRQRSIGGLAPTSWDHSKILDVDGRSAIVGGTNWWPGDYLTTKHPVNDVSLVVEGPAAADASRFEDVIWKWTCAHRDHPLYVYFASQLVAGCVSHAATLPVTASGKVPIMVVGRLGNGIEVPGADGRTSPPIDRPPYHGNTCGGFIDYSQTNNDRAYEYRNPGEDALRALIASARRSIFISQQDLLGCAFKIEARFDERVFAALGEKVAGGVPIKIVISNQAASGGYSNGYSVADLARDLTRMVAAQQRTTYQRARTLVCRDVGLTGIHNGPGATWADGQKFANHAKLVEVDDSAFYVGSENLYPARLQELGVIVESASATATLESEYLDQLWRWSQGYALIDPETGVCGAF
jgi:phosphatidylserine/phosphatidylglycerophosphate/cardiolipin synthase-like enzyme